MNYTVEEARERKRRSAARSRERRSRWLVPPLSHRMNYIFCPEHLTEIADEAQEEMFAAFGDELTPTEIHDRRHLELAREQGAKHLQSESRWPGCEPLGLVPLKPAVFFHVRVWRNRVSATIERMVLCECGNFVDREEALGSGSVPPTPAQIAKGCEEVKQMGGGNARPCLTAKVFIPGIRAFAFDPKERTFTEQAPQ